MSFTLSYNLADGNSRFKCHKANDGKYNKASIETGTSTRQTYNESISVKTILKHYNKEKGIPTEQEKET